jgi:hypothetical protein
MLTLEQILKAARLMSQVGDPRPGYLRDDDSNLIGPIPTQRSFTNTPQMTNGAQEIDLTVEYEKDPNTGEVFVVQRFAGS